jgi:hypothetical protein
MPFASECLEIAPACEEQMLGREGLPLLGEAGIFLTGLSRVRDHYLIRRNRPEFHILMVSHDEGGALLTDEGEQAIPAGSLIFLPASVPGVLKLIGESWQISWILLDDVPRWQHLHRLGHRIWQGDGGDQLYHLLSLMQGEGVRSPLQPQLLSLLLALLERTLQGEVRGTPAGTTDGLLCTPSAPALSASVRYGADGEGDRAQNEQGAPAAALYQLATWRAGGPGRLQRWGQLCQPLSSSDWSDPRRLSSTGSQTFCNGCANSLKLMRQAPRIGGSLRLANRLGTKIHV